MLVDEINIILTTFHIVSLGVCMFKPNVWFGKYEPIWVYKHFLFIFQSLKNAQSFEEELEVWNILCDIWKTIIFAKKPKKVNRYIYYLLQWLYRTWGIVVIGRLLLLLHIAMTQQFGHADWGGLLIKRRSLVFAGHGHALNLTGNAIRGHLFDSSPPNQLGGL